MPQPTRRVPARRPHPPSCGHCRDVDEYRLARHCDLLAEEAATGGYPTEIQQRRAAGTVPIYFHAWLVGKARAA